MEECNYRKPKSTFYPNELTRIQPDIINQFKHHKKYGNWVAQFKQINGIV